jgi:hypothetical protein
MAYGKRKVVLATPLALALSSLTLTPLPIVQDVHILVAAQQKMH